jgi:hypothetical protein
VCELVNSDSCPRPTTICAPRQTVKGLECRVSQLVNDATCPRPTTILTRAHAPRQVRPANFVLKLLPLGTEVFPRKICDLRHLR